ncbi:hypothetical protein [Saccharothrix australiensis]|uniref:Tetratricopeptide repeat protein n=1 Tax=Saccharothrix australiensis TaxID=2072 RepID=A0A495W155_9PSEU|nr:hypothetical protein [Saccharothrix australiensis]RKT55402.1 hypothetical protein C8E97_4070 [Saccharothrix australiensis]
MGVIATRLARTLAEHDFPDLPGHLRLAVMLSCATRVEPELIRAMRLATLPLVDVSAESDLWFGDWVGSRSAAGVALRPDLLPALRGALRSRLAAPASDPVHRVWDVLAEAHDHCLSPALRLEERVVRCVLTDQDPEPELRAALYSLAVEGRTGLADWVYGAWQRLPEAARDKVSGWLLHAVANRELAEDALPPSDPPAGIRAEHVRPVADALGRRRLWLSWQGESVDIGGARTADGTCLDVPDTEPALIDLLDRRGRYLRTVRVPAGQVVSVRPPAGGFRGRSGDGLVLAMRRGDLVDRAPHRHSPLPSRLLADAERFPPAGRDGAQAQLAAWFMGDEEVAVRLLHGPPGTGKGQLAHVLTTIAGNHAWEVRRPARPSSVPFDAPARLLVVVDAPAWPPGRLARLVARLRPPARVLVLARENHAWWEAACHFLSTEVEGVVLTEQLLPPISDPLAAYAAAVREFAARVDPRSVPAPVREARSLDVVHMAAVAAALGGVDARGELADHLLDREVAAWRAGVEDEAALAMVLLIATLAHPLPRHSALSALVRLEVAPDAARAEELLARYEDRYPPAEHGVVEPLRPLCLADALVERALAGRAVLGLSEGVAWALFRRLLAGDGDVAACALRTAVMTWPDGDLLDLLAAEHPELLVRTSGAVLAEFARHARIGALQALWQRVLTLDRDEDSALGVALVLERLVDVLPPADDGQSALAERYAAAGLVRRAVRAMERTAETLRTRAAGDPVAWRQGLADALSLHSRLLLAAGRHDQAITVAKEAIAVSDELGRHALTGHQQVLASALLEHGARLSRRGGDREAVDATAEAIHIYRVLNGLDPHRYDAQLAAALRRHADLLVTGGDTSGAARALREALSLLRPLAERLPAVYRAHEEATLAGLRALD